MGQVYHTGVSTLVEFGQRDYSVFLRGVSLRRGMTTDWWVSHGVELVVGRLLRSYPIDLGFVQPRVDPSSPTAVFVGPDRGGASVFEDQDSVRVHDRR